MKSFFILLSIILLVFACAAFRVNLRARDGEIPALPEQLRTLQTFNTASAFVPDSDNPRRFTYDVSTTAGWAGLRFCVPFAETFDYGLVFRIRGRQELLEKAYWSYSNGGGDPPVSVEDGVAVFRMERMPTQKFVWKGTSFNAGVGFPMDALREGDTIELLDFHFSIAP